MGSYCIWSKSQAFSLHWNSFCFVFFLTNRPLVWPLHEGRHHHLQRAGRIAAAQSLMAPCGLWARDFRSLQYLGVGKGEVHRRDHRCQKSETNQRPDMGCICHPQMTPSDKISGAKTAGTKVTSGGSSPNITGIYSPLATSLSLLVTQRNSLFGDCIFLTLSNLLGNKWRLIHTLNLGSMTI